MSTKGIAIAQHGERWTAHDLHIADMEDLDSLVDAMHDLSSGTVIAFVEEDDEYLAIVRITARDPDPKVFLSDRRVLLTSDHAERLFADALPSMAGFDSDDDSDEDTPVGQASPVGDLDLLADLGTPAEALLELIAEEGMLPADVISAISERAGAGEIFDDARG
ncbi:tRNA adenosine deaminase [Frankia sp. CcI49]|uniref:tRNA adenosine deaminase-associated protein n=1 Tax=unclassified Frankia TaxID=2632575 RepID=UPI0006CA4D15|nr:MULTISPECIES: tRNA adenosine deaminase-associated protein [unclassified Frankia]KPM53543.1 tRNA adenosine deaminase [Frankia sp. R43]ONH54758.1 tRNA adenosine deaminase [Frankia sp. CcI49]